MAVTPEGKVKTAVKKLFKEFEDEFNCELYTNWPVPGGYGESMLDCVGCAFGKFFAIETKALGKVMTPRQQQCAARMTRAYGMVFEIDSVDGDGMKVLWYWLKVQRELFYNTDNEVDQEGRVRIRV